MPLEAGVHRLTAHPARFLGIDGRGTVEVGCPADVCIVDLDNLAIGALEVKPDLPSGAPRLFRGASGYRAVLVDGVEAALEQGLSQERYTVRR